MCPCLACSFLISILDLPLICLASSPLPSLPPPCLAYLLLDWSASPVNFTTCKFPLVHESLLFSSTTLLFTCSPLPQHSNPQILHFISPLHQLSTLPTFRLTSFPLQLPTFSNVLPILGITARDVAKMNIALLISEATHTTFVAIMSRICVEILIFVRGLSITNI